MTSRERLLTVLSNGRPDRLPCQVHGWMPYYLKTFLNDLDWYQANDRFGLDHAIYLSPKYIFADRDLAKWRKAFRDLGQDADGNHRWEETIVTPKGNLHHAGARNQYTGWETEHLIKTEQDFELCSFKAFHDITVIGLIILAEQMDRQPHQDRLDGRIF